MKPRSLKFVILTALQALTVSLSVCDSVRSTSAEGNVSSMTDRHTPTAKQKHYGTTVPLQLVGQDWKPISSLNPQSHPASLELLIEAEGEQLLLALEKNEGLFASNYTETHYLEDGSAVTGAHNFTANCYYHGEVRGRVNSDVSLSTCAGIKGFISLEGKSYVLEPSADHNDGTHWIYSAEHLSLAPGSCGHDLNTSHPTEHADSGPFRTFSTRDAVTSSFGSINTTSLMKASTCLFYSPSLTVSEEHFGFNQQ